MHREPLLQALAEHRPFDETERLMLESLRGFVRGNPDCFSPAKPEGHITGGAWILDVSRGFVLLTHHAKLGKWLQLGGHSENEGDALTVALREAREESGLQSVRPVSDRIFDVDIHPIPARGSQPAHLHYDIRYLMEADREEPLKISGESRALAWVEIGLLGQYSGEASLERLAARTRAFLGNADSLRIPGSTSSGFRGP